MKHPLDKHIKNQLKDYQETAPADSWQNIQNELDKKQKKRPVFLYWKRIAVAASVLLLTGIGIQQLYYNSFSNQLNPISTNQNQDNQQNLQSQKNQDLNSTNQQESIANNPNETLNEQFENDSNLKIESQSNQDYRNKNNLFDAKNHEYNGRNLSVNQSYQGNQNNLVAISNPYYQNQNGNNQLNQNSNHSDKPLVVPQTNNELVSALDNLYAGINLVSPEFNANIEFEDNLFENELPLEEIASLEKKKQEERKEETLEDDNRRKFELLAYAAPTFYDSFNGTSTMPEMNNFNTDNQVTVAYGVRAGYAVSKKFKLRTGVAMVNLSQVNQNVPIMNTALASINSDTSTVATSPEIREQNSPAGTGSINYTGDLVVGTNMIANDTSAFVVNQFSADVQQDIQLMEIPLEAEYKMINNKILDVSATGGMSSYILTDNTVFASREDGSDLLLGEANNINDVSFSTNVGLRVDFKVKKNIQLSVEPQFKYLINTVNNNSDFQPYTAGVNAGVVIDF